MVYADSLSAAGAFGRLSHDPRVLRVQYNHRLSFRSVPDDPLYDRQRSSLERSGFVAAWPASPSGKTADGFAIVTAVLDAGFEVAHEDLSESLWVNAGEIPGDGIDNDANGYVDDLNGWNFSDDSPDHFSSVHGTQVAGLIGATADNGRGIAGMGYGNQLMLLSVATVADVVAAYGYVIEQRRHFNQSQGREGALVVVTNASFGIDRGRCADYPVWAAMYDRLGKEGVLSAVSAANSSFDIDSQGDMPADCPSPYLITVTNVDADNHLSSAAAYGSTSVDLAAPGSGSFTTRPGSRYGGFGGTSAAVTYISAAVALLHAVGCQELLLLRINNAPAHAARMKKLILETVRPDESLSGRTVSGGIIQVDDAKNRLLEACRPVDIAKSIEVVYPNPTRGQTVLEVSWPATEDEPSLEVIDVLGRRVRVPITVMRTPAGLRYELEFGGVQSGHYRVLIRRGKRILRASLLVM